MKPSLKDKRFVPLMVVGALIAVSAAWLLFTHVSSDPHATNTAKTIPSAAPLDLALEIPQPPPAVPEDETDPIRPEIRSVLDPTIPPALRTELVQALPADLTEAEYRALIHEILRPPTPGTPEAWHSSHIHEICKILQGIPASHDLLASALATVAANRAFTEVYRDYAFQHLRTLWHRSLDPLAPGISQPRNLAIEQAFRKLLADRPETSAQAILGLHELRHDNATPAVPDQEIRQLVDQTLASTDPVESSAIPARMTAIRIIAERNLSDSGDTLRAIASSPQEHLLVRTSAIGALGHLAAPADAEFLKSLSPDNPMLADALKHALKQF